jgi:hypothetical protein
VSLRRDQLIPVNKVGNEEEQLEKGLEEEEEKKFLGRKFSKIKSTPGAATTSTSATSTTAAATTYVTTRPAASTVLAGQDQSNKIGRLFANGAIVFFGQFFENYRPKNLGYFFT